MCALQHRGSRSRASIEWDEREIPEDAPLGMPEAALTTSVDVSGFVERKRASIMAHASQVTDSEFFLKMPPEMFNQTFSREWFIRKGAPAGLHEDFGGGSAVDLAQGGCFFVEREAGTPGASYTAPARVAPRVGAHHVRRRRAHARLRDDRRGDATKSGAGSPTIAPRRRDLRPGAHPVDAAQRQRRDGHERARPLRRGHVYATSGRRRPRRSRWPARWVIASTVADVIERPSRSRCPHRSAVGRGAGRPGPAGTRRWACSTVWPS